jgi:hypothetical protein
VNTDAPNVSLLREQFEQAQFIKDRFLVPPDMARRSQEESLTKVTLLTHLRSVKDKDFEMYTILSLYKNVCILNGYSMYSAPQQKLYTIEI